MNKFISISFDDDHSAFKFRSELVTLQKEYKINMDDVVVVTKDEAGKLKLHQAANLTLLGATSGGFWGMLLGLVFLSPFWGMAIGAGAGAVSGTLADIGIDDKMIKEISSSLKPNTSAIFFVLRGEVSDRVLDELKTFSGKGKLLQTSLNISDENELRDFIENRINNNLGI
ncbi:TPA: DUF1269 domain-containing protein [Vibrio parahaemolyticus]|nr:DUF1269 domain-containing protein [Vibrio parahaemolyticus]